MNVFSAALSPADSQFPSTSQYQAVARSARRNRGATLELGITLGLILVTACASGQDRVRIVESPRTAMRELPSAAPPAATRNAIARQGETNASPSAGMEEHFVTEMREQLRTVFVPVIESQTEPTSAWWDPLGIATRTFKPRPVVRWEKRVEKVRVPIRYRTMVAEKTQLTQDARTASSADRPKTAIASRPTFRSAERITPTGSAGQTSAGTGGLQFGGVSQLDSDRPRYSTRPGVQKPGIVR